MKTLLVIIKPHVFKQEDQRKVGTELKFVRCKQTFQMSLKSIRFWHLDQTSIRCEKSENSQMQSYVCSLNFTIVTIRSTLLLQFF